MAPRKHALLAALFATVLAVPALADTSQKLGSIKASLYLDGDDVPYPDPCTVYVCPDGDPKYEQSFNYTYDAEKKGAFSFPDRTKPPAVSLQEGLLVKVKNWRTGNWFEGRLSFDGKTVASTTQMKIIVKSPENSKVLEATLDDPFQMSWEGGGMEIPKW